MRWMTIMTMYNNNKCISTILWPSMTMYDCTNFFTILFYLVVIYILFKHAFETSKETCFRIERSTTSQFTFLYRQYSWAAEPVAPSLHFRQRHRAPTGCLNEELPIYTAALGSQKLNWYPSLNSVFLNAKMARVALSWNQYFKGNMGTHLESSASWCTEIRAKIKGNTE